MSNCPIQHKNSCQEADFQYCSLLICQAFRDRTMVEKHNFQNSWCFLTFKIEIFLEQREVPFLSLSKICENLNFSREISQILLGDKNATSLCSKNISILFENKCSLINLKNDKFCIYLKFQNSSSFEVKLQWAFEYVLPL